MARCHGGAPEEWASLRAVPCGPTVLSEDAGRLTLNEDQVVECFAALAAEDCNPLEVDAACSGLTTGNVPTDDACNALGGFAEECEPDAFCHLMDSCGGICIPRGVVDQDCNGMYASVVCGSGLVCDSASAKCKVPGADGEACTGQRGACLPGLYCDAEDDAEGTCRPVKTEGPCQSSLQCDPAFRCVQDDSDEGTCERAKPVGAACTFGLRECAGYCSPEGICRIRAREGESCGSLRDAASSVSESVTCGPGLFCNRESDAGIEATCRSQVSVGAICPDTRQSGSACQEGDTISYCDPDSDECVSCN